MPHESLPGDTQQGKTVAPLLAEQTDSPCQLHSIQEPERHLWSSLGNRYLVHIAKIARSVLREGDVLVRYGGDELLAILPAASKQDVAQIEERLRRVVEEAPLQDGDHVIRVTVSLGGTAYPEFDADSDGDLVRNVDSALYAARNLGAIGSWSPNPGINAR